MWCFPFDNKLVVPSRIILSVYSSSKRDNGKGKKYVYSCKHEADVVITTTYEKYAAIKFFFVPKLCT